MKNSIAFTLIITIGIFAFVSGYSIGHSNGTAGGEHEAGVAVEAAAGGYGGAAEETAAPGYGAAAPGYGQ